MSEQLEYAKMLRKTAQELRAQAEVEEKHKVMKCAQILAAAKGLVQLKQLIAEKSK